MSRVPGKPGRFDPFSTTEKLMQTFRMPRELVTFLKVEASQRGSDLTGQVLLLLDGIRTWFGLPAAATPLLEADRERWGWSGMSTFFTSSSSAAWSCARRARPSTRPGGGKGRRPK